MADTETDQILEGLDPPADTTPAAGDDTVVADAGEDASKEDAGQDTVTGEGEDTIAGQKGEETPAVEPPTQQAAATQVVATPDAYRKSVDALEALRKQQTDLDAEFDAIDKEIADGKLDAYDASPRIQVLSARQNRLERKLGAAEKSVNEQKSQQAESIDAHWNSLGQKYADIAETPAKATELLKSIWDEEHAKAQKASGNAHPERIAGKAETAWENRIAVLRAKKGQPQATKTAAKVPGRLTPGTGSTPTSPRKESGAAIAERSLGPLSAFKFRVLPRDFEHRLP